MSVVAISNRSPTPTSCVRVTSVSGTNWAAPFATAASHIFYRDDPVMTRTKRAENIASQTALTPCFYYKKWRTRQDSNL
jgi:hypothetical protein